MRQLRAAVGLSDAGDCRGGSAVWGPDRTVIADAGSEAPGLALAEPDFRS